MKKVKLGKGRIKTPARHEQIQLPLRLCKASAWGRCVWLDFGRWIEREENLAAATGAAGLHTLALADLHGGLVVDSGVAHALLDLASHGEESLLDVAGVLGGCLEEGDAEAVCELLWGLLACVVFEGDVVRDLAHMVPHTLATL